MRESIGGAWLLGIVMVFMMVFIAYVAISINYSNAYKLKTEMVTVVEQYQGINGFSIPKLESLMNSHSYRGTLMCSIPETSDKVIGVTGRYVTTNPSTRQNYCVTREVRGAQDGGEEKYYYTIVVAFDFNLPILGDLFTFKVSGETNAIYYPNDSYF